MQVNTHGAWTGGQPLPFHAIAPQYESNMLQALNMKDILTCILEASNHSTFTIHGTEVLVVTTAASF